MKSLRKVLLVLLVPLTAWSSFPPFACACSISAEKPARSCGGHEDSEETSCCQGSSRSYAAAKENASGRERGDKAPAAAVVAESISLPGTHLCRCATAASRWGGESATPQTETERLVLQSAAPTVIALLEADQHVAMHLLGVALPRLDRVILFCTLLI